MKTILASILFLFSVVTYGQQDPLFTQYMYNKLAINPGYAGSHDLFSMEALTRFQWVGIAGAPQTTTFTAHTPLRNPHIALGFYAARDQLGPTVDYSVMGNFTYRVIFSKSKLCFGVNAGIKYYDIDFGDLIAKDAADIELINQVKNRAVPDVDFGIYYYAPHFYVGISSKHLLENQMSVSTAPVPNSESSFTKLKRNFYGLAGAAITLSENLVFMPSILMKVVDGAPFQTDINASFLIYQVLTLGASYRTNAALAFLVEVNITKSLSIGYSYDVWFNALQGYNKGSHEIRIGYDFDLFNKSRMLTPRYF
jgi:type IX secretion system PorP/SprF family membrane protein